MPLVPQSACLPIIPYLSIFIVLPSLTSPSLSPSSFLPSLRGNWFNQSTTWSSTSGVGAAAGAGTCRAAELRLGRPGWRTAGRRGRAVGRPPPGGPCGAGTARCPFMRPPWCGRRTRGIPLGLLALWVAAARCLQSKYLAGGSALASGNNIAGRGDPSGAGREGEGMRTRVTSPCPDGRAGRGCRVLGRAKAPLVPWAAAAAVIRAGSRPGDNSFAPGQKFLFSSWK